MNMLMGDELLCVLDTPCSFVSLFVLERLSAVDAFMFSLFQREMETLETCFFLVDGACILVKFIVLLLLSIQVQINNISLCICVCGLGKLGWG